MTKTLSIIVVVAENNGIGYKNKLLTHISADLKRFKQITDGHTIIMGSNTWLSLPVKPLPKRQNIVITRNSNKNFEGATVANSIQAAIDACPPNKESFIIGGAEIYRQFFNIVDKIYLTKIHKSFKADTFFSEINLKEWNILHEETVENDEQAKVRYSFIDLERKK